MKELVEANRQFQATLEAHRVDPDDEGVWQEHCMARNQLRYLFEIYHLNRIVAE